MIKQANNKNIINAKFVEGRSDKIPFGDNTFIGKKYKEIDL